MDWLQLLRSPALVRLLSYSIPLLSSDAMRYKLERYGISGGPSCWLVGLGQEGPLLTVKERSNQPSNVPYPDRLRELFSIASTCSFTQAE